jgi:hypothetical protein
MKLTMRRVSLLSAALMLVALPVLAEDETMSQLTEPAQQNGKAECLLVAKNNCVQVGSPESRIDKIMIEIKKGTDVYSTDELMILNNELDKATSDLIDAYGGGA